MGMREKVAKNSSNIQNGPDKAFLNPQELDLFDIETKSRRTIAELLQPVWADMESDRIALSKLLVKHDDWDARLRHLEFLTGVDKVKP